MERNELLLEKIAKDMNVLKIKLSKIEADVEEINTDLHEVRPEYIEKLKKIQKGRYFSRKEFEKALSD